MSCLAEVYILAPTESSVIGLNRNWYLDNIAGPHSTWRGLFSCDLASLRTLISVRPLVCLSVRHTFLTMFLSSYHLEIFRSYYHRQTWWPCKGQGQRSKVEVTEVMTSFSRFQTVTPVWIYIWQWNDTQSLMLHRRGALLVFKVIC